MREMSYLSIHQDDAVCQVLHLIHIYSNEQTAVGYSKQTMLVLFLPTPLFCFSPKINCLTTKSTTWSYSAMAVCLIPHCVHFVNLLLV